MARCGPTRFRSDETTSGILMLVPSLKDWPVGPLVYWPEEVGPLAEPADGNPDQRAALVEVIAGADTLQSGC